MDFSVIKVAINSDLTTATAANSVTPAIEGGHMEDICDAATLQGILNNGNDANDTVGSNQGTMILRHSSGYYAQFNGSSIVFYDSATSTKQAVISEVSGEWYLELAKSKIVSTSTSNERFELPDKAGAGGTFAMLSDVSAVSVVAAGGLNLAAITSTINTTISSCSYLVPANSRGCGSYICSANIMVTAISGTINASLRVSFTDQLNNARIWAFYYNTGTSTTALVTSAGFFPLQNLLITAKSGTTILIDTIILASGTCSISTLTTSSINNNLIP